MRTGGLFQFMRFVCNLPQIMRLFDFGRNYAKNCASIIRQGLRGPRVRRVRQGVVKYQNFSTPGNEKYFRRSALFRSSLDGSSEQLSLLEPGRSKFHCTQPL